MLGWTKEHADQQMLPMIQKLQSTDHQPRLDSYFETYADNTRFAKVQSLRLRKALAGTKGVDSSSKVDHMLD